jgi:dUTP pyrophosphatase
MTKLKLFKTHPSNTLPKKQTAGSACFDLMFQGNGKGTYTGFNRMNKPFTRIMNNQIVIGAGDRVMVPTGLIMDIPEGHSVRVHARSGLSFKQGLVLANAEGVIDSDYVEEVMVLIHNISENSLNINTGDRVAQAELIKDAQYEIEESAVRPGLKTTRTGGMGSTGIKAIGDTITISVAPPKPAIPPKQTDNLPEKRGRGRPKKNA